MLQEDCESLKAEHTEHLQQQAKQHRIACSKSKTDWEAQLQEHHSRAKANTAAKLQEAVQQAAQERASMAATLAEHERILVANLRLQHEDALRRREKAHACELLKEDDRCTVAASVQSHACHALAILHRLSAFCQDAHIVFLGIASPGSHRRSSFCCSISIYHCSFSPYRCSCCSWLAG